VTHNDREKYTITHLLMVIILRPNLAKDLSTQTFVDLR